MQISVRLKPRRVLAATCLVTALLTSCTTFQAPPVDPALLNPARNSAVRPEPRDPKWVKRHEGFVEIAKQGGVDVLFVGDSITDAWRNESARGGKPIWDREFAPLRAANFGISGDRTQHVLWRLENGEANGISPRAVVLMIGTNNTGFEPDKVTPRNTPAEVAAGVTAVVHTLKAKFPREKILLLAIFPRGEKLDHPQRLQINEINRTIAKLHDGRRVHYLGHRRQVLRARRHPAEGNHAGLSPPEPEGLRDLGGGDKRATRKAPEVTAAAGQSRPSSEF